MGRFGLLGARIGEDAPTDCVGNDRLKEFGDIGTA
jgi:hypothetical protein